MALASDAASTRPSKVSRPTLVPSWVVVTKVFLGTLFISAGMGMSGNWLIYTSLTSDVEEKGLGILRLEQPASSRTAKQATEKRAMERMGDPPWMA